MSEYTNIAECGPGWKILVDEMVEELHRLEVPITIFQIKEKFGALRVYVDCESEHGAIHERVYEIVEKYERLSTHVCEFCGKPGEPRTERSWLKTLCNNCNEETL